MAATLDWANFNHSTLILNRLRPHAIHDKLCARFFYFNYFGFDMGLGLGEL